jgi:hypothetical protein
MKGPECLTRHARRRATIQNNNLKTELGIVTPNYDLAHFEPRRQLPVGPPLGKRARSGKGVGAGHVLAHSLPDVALPPSVLLTVGNRRTHADDNRERLPNLPARVKLTGGGAGPLPSNTYSSSDGTEDALTGPDPTGSDWRASISHHDNPRVVRRPVGVLTSGHPLRRISL